MFWSGKLSVVIEMGFLLRSNQKSVAAAAAQQAQDIQEDVDEVQIKLERREDGRFLRHFVIAFERCVQLFDLLRIICRQPMNTARPTKQMMRSNPESGRNMEMSQNTKRKISPAVRIGRRPERSRLVNQP